MKPLVSVLMPVYNSEKYLVEALDSLTGQDYKNLEIIILDDGSNDSSFSIITRTSFLQVFAALAAIRNS